MNEELKENIEVQEEPVEMQQPEVQEEPVEMQQPEIQDETVETQPESVLEQAADGAWRHAEDSPFSPFYVPDRKQKKNNRLTIALVAVLLLMLIAGVIFAVSKLVEAAVGEAATAWNESRSAIEEFVAGIKEDAQDDADSENEDSDSFSADESELDNQEDYIEDWEEFLKDYEEENGYDYEEDYDDYDYYVPSPDDDYYVELADALRDDLSYSVDFEEYSYSDYDNDVYISVWYAMVSDELPFADKINAYLEEGAMYYAWKFESEDTRDFTLNVESFVTYMDEEILSVVVDERFILGNEVEYNLYCMNFDLTTGTLLYNTDIIEVTDELVQALRDQSEYQNGITPSVEDYSDEEIKDFMSDEDTLILYYTPVGLEVGYNHPEGWLTVTFKEYQQFLKKL